MEIVERSWSEALGEGCSFFNSIENWRRRNEEQSSTPQGTRIDNHCYLKRIVFARGDRIVSESDFHLPDDDGTLVWKDVPRGTTKILRHHPIATVIADLKRMSLAKAFRVMVG